MEIGKKKTFPGKFVQYRSLNIAPERTYITVSKIICNNYDNIRFGGFAFLFPLCLIAGCK